jgi:Na+/glutamate symporter
MGVDAAMAAPDGADAASCDDSLEGSEALGALALVAGCVVVGCVVGCVVGGIIIPLSR